MGRGWPEADRGYQEPRPPALPNLSGAYPPYRFSLPRRLNLDWVFLGDLARLPHEIAQRLEADPAAP